MANRRGNKETVTDFIFLGSNITVDDDWHGMKRCLLLGRKAMTNLDILLKNRDIALPAKVHIVKAVFPVIVYGCESWAIKKAECQRIDAFNLWRRLLRVPWTKRRSNQSIKSILNIYWKDWCWSSNTLATWCDDLTHGKDPDAGKDWGQEERGWLKMRWLDGIINAVHMSLGKLWQIVKDRRAWCAAAQGVTKSGHDWATEHNRSYWCIFKIFFSFNLAWTHGFLVVVRVRILSMPPPIPHTCGNAFMWLKHLCRYDHGYKPGDGKRSLCYPDEPHFITQSLKSRRPFRMKFRKMQHGRILPAIAGFEDGGRRLQAKGMAAFKSWEQP